jgi:DNA-binding transcriptional LysR family regulator
MDIALARTFLAIVETGNFGKAADQLYVTQSTVSSRIKTLEEEVGQPLFVRSKAGASLTRAGTTFKRSAEALIQVWERARQEISLPSGASSLLAIGAQFTLWERLLVKWIPWIRSAIPDLAVRSELGTSEGLMRQMIDGLLDIAIMYTPQTRPGLVIEKLLEEHLVLVSSNPATKGPADPGYVYVDWGPEFRTAHSNQFPALDTPMLSVSHGPLGLQHLLNDGGAGYFPMRIVRPFLDEGRLHHIASAPDFVRPVYIIYLASATDDRRFKTAVQGLHYVAQLESEQ